MRFFAFLLILLSQLSLEAKISIIAHRGASGTLPEHTREAYMCAIGMGADYLEPDVVLTKDSIPIILHDVYLEPTTNVRELYPNRKAKDGHFYAADFSFEEIKKLSVHERINDRTGNAIFPGRFPKEKALFKIPSFEKFLDLVEGLNEGRKKKIRIYPEIKKAKFHENRGLKITGVVYNYLLSYGYEDKPEEVFIQSFEIEPLKVLRFEIKTKIPLIFLTEAKKQPDPSHIKRFADGVGLPILKTIQKRSGQWVQSKLTQELKKYNLLVHPYTLREDHLPRGAKSFKEILYALEKLKIDAVFTDFPGKAKALMDKYSEGYELYKILQKKGSKHSSKGILVI